MDANKYNACNVVHLWDSDSGVFRRGIGSCSCGQKKSAMIIGTWFDPLCKSISVQTKYGPSMKS